MTKQRISERIEQILNDQRISKKELADIVGVSAQSVTNWIQRGQIGRDSAIMLSQKYNYSMNWLLGGDTDNKFNDVAIAENIQIDDNYAEIDMYDVKLSAGDGSGCTVEWFPRQSEQPLIFRKAWFKAKGLYPESCKAMYVRGNSMYPVLEDWDTIIVDTDDTDIVDGEIYALAYRNNFYIKQVFRSGNGIILHSINERDGYKPIEIDESDLEHIQIIGRKVWRGG
ncbi:helix-turn-helix domain-containing protein [Pasteurellaceae bacterium TAE3-ERU1]|nr:helix-turn-helix domain-containing protein [Pasteurellaceae bacterium TAE3-ERU1]